MAELLGVHGMAKHRLGRHGLEQDWGVAAADGLERRGGLTILSGPTYAHGRRRPRRKGGG
jgi:hypothetical protein